MGNNVKFDISTPYCPGSLPCAEKRAREEEKYILSHSHGTLSKE